jgi:hypothetical protein
MKSKTIIALASFILAAIVPAYSQKINVVSGDVKQVLAEKEINIQYDYSNMKIGKEGLDEEDYVSTRVAEKNKEKAGTGDRWKTNWIESRASKYQPKFEELLNKELQKKNVKHGNFPNAKYTLIVKTPFTEPGYNVGVTKQPSFISLEFSYVETANPSNVISKMTLDYVPGAQAMGFDYDTGTRISESYAKGGKVLGKYLAESK